MGASATLVEVLIRGGAASANLAIAGQFLKSGYSRSAAWSGFAFATGIAAYAIVSGEAQIFPLRVELAMEALSALNPGLFLLFAVLLFRDRAASRMGDMLPVMVLAILYTAIVLAQPALQPVLWHVRQALVLGIYLFVIFLAVRGFAEDLVARRRLLRLAIAVIIPAAGIVIAAFETGLAGAQAPQWLSLLHAGFLLLVSIAFLSWMANPDETLFAPAEIRAPPEKTQTNAADRVMLARLNAIIDERALLAEGVSLSRLAAMMNIPEHRLRRLINREMGYRNFAAFLNEHRIAEAKRILADPEHTLKQISQIAYVVGYGSLAPFNRAFREATGVSPTDWRQQALSTRNSEKS